MLKIGRKGAELPINMIIILAIAVIVLLVAVAFFMGGSGKSGASVSLETAYTNGCMVLQTSYGCDAASISKIKIKYNDKDGDGIIEDTELTPFSDICREKFPSSGEQGLIDCVRTCGCSVAEG